MTDKKGVLQEAQTFLNSLLKDKTWINRGCLPSIRQMAHMADCSHYTMWKAVKALEKKGLLKVLHGKRIRLAESRQPDREKAQIASEALDSTLCKWEKVKSQIEKDIFSGVFKPGETLPSLKELQRIYRVSYATLRKALKPLERMQLVDSNLRISKISPTANKEPYVSLTYLAWGDSRGIFKFPTPFEHDLMCVLENECANLNIRFEKIVYTYQRNHIIFIHKNKKHLKLPAACRQSVGFIVRTACPQDITDDLIKPLAAESKPVAVLDEKGMPSLAPARRKYKNIMVFDHTISTQAARQMGLYLLQAGHKKAAFISPWHETLWSINRCKGLTAVFESAGLHDAIVPFTQTIEYQLPFEEENTQVEEILRSSLKHSRKHWKPSYPSLPVIQRGLDPYLKAVIRKEYTLEVIKPLLMKALAHKDITAWVAVDDETALLVLTYLKRRGIKVPEQIALVGFDDTAKASQNDLTTYNFNFQRFIHTVVMHILKSTSTRFSRLRKPVEVPGNIVERGSCPAKRR